MVLTNLNGKRWSYFIVGIGKADVLANLKSTEILQSLFAVCFTIHLNSSKLKQLYFIRKRHFRTIFITAALVPQAESWVLKSKPRQTVKTGSDSSTAKRSAKDVSVTGPLR